MLAWIHRCAVVADEGSGVNRRHGVSSESTIGRIRNIEVDRSDPSRRERIASREPTMTVTFRIITYRER